MPQNKMNKVLKKKLIVLIIIVTVGFIAVIYAVPFVNGWPVTVGQASERLISELSKEELAKLKNAKREDLILYHFGLGMWIRNEYGLWKGNIPLLISTGKAHPDSASNVIIERTWDKLNKEK